MVEDKFHKIKNVKNMLLISLTCIGDVLLTTPVAKVLKDNFPAAKLTMLCGPTAYPLLKDHPLVDRAIIFNSRGEHKSVKGMASLLWRLRDTKYDIVVDLRNTAMPYALRAKHKLTAHKAHLDNRAARGRHAIDRHLDVLESYGFPITCREMQLHLPEEARRNAASAIAETGQAGKTPLVGIYPGAGSFYKQYSPEKFKVVLRELASIAPGAQFAMIGGPADKAVAEIVAEGCPERTVNYSGKLNIIETAALIKNCALLISNDSGPMHIGAALNVPTVAVFGPTDATRYGPRGGMHRIVWLKKPCNPCKSPECGLESCVNLIEEKEIVRAAAGALGIEYTAPARDDSASIQLQLFDSRERE